MRSSNEAFFWRSEAFHFGLLDGIFRQLVRAIRRICVCLAPHLFKTGSENEPLAH